MSLWICSGPTVVRDERCWCTTTTVSRPESVPTNLGAGSTWVPTNSGDSVSVRNRSCISALHAALLYAAALGCAHTPTTATTKAELLTPGAARELARHLLDGAASHARITLRKARSGGFAAIAGSGVTPWFGEFEPVIFTVLASLPDDHPGSLYFSGPAVVADEIDATLKQLHRGDSLSRQARAVALASPAPRVLFRASLPIIDPKLARAKLVAALDAAGLVWADHPRGAGNEARWQQLQRSAPDASLPTAGDGAFVIHAKDQWAIARFDTDALIIDVGFDPRAGAAPRLSAVVAAQLHRDGFSAGEFATIRFFAASRRFARVMFLSKTSAALQTADPAELPDLWANVVFTLRALEAFERLAAAPFAWVGEFDGKGRYGLDARSRDRFDKEYSKAYVRSFTSTRALAERAPTRIWRTLAADESTFAWLMQYGILTILDDYSDRMQDGLRESLDIHMPQLAFVLTMELINLGVVPWSAAPKMRMDRSGTFVEVEASTASSQLSPPASTVPPHEIGAALLQLAQRHMDRNEMTTAGDILRVAEAFTSSSTLAAAFERHAESYAASGNEWRANQSFDEAERLYGEPIGQRNLRIAREVFMRERKLGKAADIDAVSEALQARRIWDKETRLEARLLEGEINLWNWQIDEAGEAFAAGLRSAHDSSEGDVRAYRARVVALISKADVPKDRDKERVALLRLWRDKRVTQARSLTKDEIKKVVTAKSGEARSCYERALQSEPDLQGLVEVVFRISWKGIVKDARIQKSTIESAALHRCLLKVIRALLFPEPRGEREPLVTWPYRFRTSAAEKIGP